MKLGIAALGGIIVLFSASNVLGQPACEGHDQFKAIDVHRPVTRLRATAGRTGLSALKSFGVQTIIRYYDWETESIACKTLLPAEVDAILASGLSIAVVFQHHNDDPETFIDASRGRTDARRSLALAEANGQPFGTTIYFGVDGVDQAIESAVWEYAKSGGRPISAARERELIGQMGARSFRKHKRFYERFLQYHAAAFNKEPRRITGKDMLPFVKPYFEKVAIEFGRTSPANRYEIGAYGSGMVCEFVLANNLAKQCWLSQSTGWPGYAAFRASGRWSLLQQLPTTCAAWVYEGEKGPVQFDFNQVNPSKPNFGQWSTKRAGTEPIAPPTTCPAL